MKLGERWWLTKENILKLFALLESLGFAKATREEIAAEIRRTGSVPYLKKAFKGSETGYMYTYKYWKICIWTTYVESIGDINEEDLIWALVTDSRNTIPFFWFPIRRSMNFVQHTADTAEMLVEVVHAWPRCRDMDCDEFLYLVFVPGVMHLMQYKCGNSKFVHSPEAKAYFPITDLQLTEKSTALLREAFRKSLEYQKAVKESGKRHEFDRTKRSEKKKEAMKRWNKENNFYGDIQLRIRTSDYDD